MKFNRFDPVPVPISVTHNKLWFYVNEGSIDIVIENKVKGATLESNIPRRYLLAALKAMRKRK